MGSVSITNLSVIIRPHVCIYIWYNVQGPELSTYNCNFMSGLIMLVFTFDVIILI